MQAEIKKRLHWIELYEQTGDAGLVCRRCGISRPTLRLWWRRYQALGQVGLVSRSRRPQSSPTRKVTNEQEEWIAQLRQRRIGARRIQFAVVFRTSHRRNAFSHPAHSNRPGA